MARMLSPIVLCVLLTGLASEMYSQHPKSASRSSKADQSADQAADFALGMLRRSITSTNYAQFGFANVEEVQHMTLGSGVPLFYVRADQLSKYTPGSDPGSLMIPTQRRLYPVLVNGSGRLIITLENQNGQWKLVSFGQQAIADQLSKIKHDKASHSRGPGGSEDNYFALQIPSMHLNFLAYSPAPGLGGATETKQHVNLLALDSPASMQHSIGFQNTDFLAKNPAFTPEKEGTKSATDVFTALAPQASSAMSGNAPR